MPAMTQDGLTHLSTEQEKKLEREELAVNDICQATMRGEDQEESPDKGRHRDNKPRLDLGKTVG